MLNLDSSSDKACAHRLQVWNLLLVNLDASFDEARAHLELKAIEIRIADACAPAIHHDLKMQQSGAKILRFYSKLSTRCSAHRRRE